MGSVNNDNISGGRMQKHIFNHQGWAQMLLRTKENYRNNYQQIAHKLY